MKNLILVLAMVSFVLTSFTTLNTKKYPPLMFTQDCKKFELPVRKLIFENNEIQIFDDSINGKNKYVGFMKKCGKFNSWKLKGASISVTQSNRVAFTTELSLNRIASEITKIYK